MHQRRFRRLFHSAFTKLLVIILATGVAITLTVLVGFSIIRFRSVTHLDRNLILYAEYLARDLGDPPEFQRAVGIAQRTGMAIRFDHPSLGWQTADFPIGTSLDRAWTRHNQEGVWTGRMRGRMFIRMQHAGGDLIFITPQWAADHENAGIILMAMAAALSVILAAAYFFIRGVLRPLRTLKSGVEALGAGRLDHRVPQNGHDEFRDLSEAFNTMAGQLSALLKNKEQLLLDVSHELRSPITRLKVQSEFIDEKEIRQNLQADVAEMEAMVSTILEEARLRNTSTGLKREPTDMLPLLQSVVAEFSGRNPGVECSSLDRVTAEVDRDKMRIVLRNLIDNALKNTPESGKPVVVSMARKMNQLSIIVEDRGVGIADSAMPHVFDPFYRTDASRSRKTGGYGLGLSLCKAIVDAHKGKIDITSELGRGTRVTVTLPISDAPLPRGDQ
jgi:signal transduction histidine kinase